MLLQNDVLAEFGELVASGRCNSYKGPLFAGVDLGTANTVLAVVDSDGHPVAGATARSKGVRDGIVVDYIGTVQAVSRMKAALEEKLGAELSVAATAIPPGIIEGNVKCIVNVVEGAGFEVKSVADEPSAAAELLGIQEGAVVDVGGGTTGISILKDGKVVFTADEPTGGTHMSLVTAGYYGIPFEKAEAMKLDPAREEDVFPLVVPVIEKMAMIVRKYIAGKDVKDIYVVGGAATFQAFEKVFEKVLHTSVYKPNDTLFVTPLGIAIHCREAQLG